MRLRFIPTHLYRETSQVAFFVASVPNSNATDVVLHAGAAVSPRDDGDAKQYHVQRRQPFAEPIHPREAVLLRN